MKHLKIALFIFLALLFCNFAYSGSAVKIFDRDGVPQGLNISDAGGVIINVGYPRDIPADYYLYKTIVTPVISSNTAIGAEVINVISSTGVANGHAITFYEGNNMFQSLVAATTATTISIASPIDFEYTANALVEAGLWSMSVDGSTTIQIFSIKAPPTAGICIHTINVSMLDSSAMDDGLFGGITALPGSEGLLFRFVDGVTKNLAIIVNNLGLWEIGFTLEYSDKAPAGQYGLRARRGVPNINGVVVFLSSGGTSEFQMHIRSDLTDLDLIACTINGHMINVQ